jgi:hypothetical protein
MLESDYDGENLFLVADTRSFVGDLALSGAAAEALYQSLAVEVTEAPIGSIKAGQNIRCRKSPEGITTCRVPINYRYGSVTDEN